MDTPVWIGFLIILLLTIFLSVTFKMNPLVYNFVIGKDINHPVLNIAAIHLGVSQPKLPNRNFARFLLMNIAIYCLIIRSAYQGAFFNILVSNKAKSPVGSLEEMIQKKFTFYIFDTLAPRLVDFPFYKK